MSLSFRKLVFAFSLGLLSAGSANATLIGDTVNVAFFRQHLALIMCP